MDPALVFCRKLLLIILQILSCNNNLKPIMILTWFNLKKLKVWHRTSLCSAAPTEKISIQILATSSVSFCSLWFCGNVVSGLKCSWSLSADLLVTYNSKVIPQGATIVFHFVPCQSIKKPQTKKSTTCSLISVICFLFWSSSNKTVHKKNFCHSSNININCAALVSIKQSGINYTILQMLINVSCGEKLLFSEKDGRLKVRQG